MPKIRVLVLFLITSLVIVSIWFKEGKLLATGEEGLLFYNPVRITQIYSYPWYETGSGYAMPVLLPRITYLSLISFANIFLSNWIIQALVFILLILGALIGMYLLANTVSKNTTISILAALFYFFNLYSQSQVWNRFITSGMFAWSFLPLFLWILLRWIETGFKHWILVLAILSLLYSNTFGQPAYIFTFWVPALIFFAFKIVEKKERKDKLGLVLRFLVYLAIWLIVNVWWIYPYLVVGQSSFSEVAGPKENYDSLRGISKYFPITEVLLLRQSFIFGEGSHWYSLYSNMFYYLIELFVLIITFLGIIKSKKLGLRRVFITLFLVGLFIDKGSTPPFGDIFFQFLFYNFPFAASLRNPYEKFGLVFLIPYSLFFSWGVNWLYKSVNLRVSKLAIGITCLLSMVILVLPMWNGDVFTKTVRVEVPDYYENANRFLNQESHTDRILSLPLTPGDGVRYTWGYQGLEPSEFLFDKAAVSKILRTQYFDSKYQQFSKLFNADQDYNQILDELNIGYIILHNDLDWQSIGASSSAVVKDKILKNSNLEYVQTFGQLDVYRYRREGSTKLFTTQSEQAMDIRYRKLSTVHYQVSIVNATSPYVLIFKETFHPFWQARVNEQRINNHFVIYDYANAWKIEKTGNYDIDVIFNYLPFKAT